MKALTDSADISRFAGKQKERLLAVKDFAVGKLDSLRDIRGNIAQEKAKPESEVTVLEKAEYVLRCVDTSQIAAENPETASAAWKIVSDVLGAVNPYCVVPALIVNFIPDDAAAKVVEISGKLTPEHILHEGIKAVIRKKEEENAAAAEPECMPEEITEAA